MQELLPVKAALLQGFSPTWQQQVKPWQFPHASHPSLGRDSMVSLLRRRGSTRLLRVLCRGRSPRRGPRRLRGGELRKSRPSAESDSERRLRPRTRHPEYADSSTSVPLTEINEILTPSASLGMGKKNRPPRFSAEAHLPGMARYLCWLVYPASCYSADNECDYATRRTQSGRGHLVVSLRLLGNNYRPGLQSPRHVGGA